MPKLLSSTEAQKSEAKAKRSAVTFAKLSRKDNQTGRAVIGPRVLPSCHRLSATLDHAIHSETPGLVTATVIDDPRGLIQPGAKLVGRYNGANIRFTGSRLAIEFQELQMAERSFTIIAQAANAQGQAGLTGEAGRHIGALVGLSALNAISGAAIGATARRGDDFEAALAAESIREGARLSRDTGRQILDVAPTIEIAAGTNFTGMSLV